MRIILLPIVFCFSFLLSGQIQYPKDKFASPMGIPIVLAGTFGELRSNHFHAGIDIKTQLRQGLPIYSIENGTVSRIKISHWGYGKALYIAHPTGHTSVYAHLKKFSPDIEAYIKKVQYNKQSYEVEVFPDFGDLPVTKGGLIAYSGNTGSSGGPHLHFEIRNSLTEKPTNPLLYGYEVRDATDPTLLALYGYALSNDSNMNGRQGKTQINFRKQADGSFLADKVNALGTIGFGFVGFDRLDMAANKNGLFSVKQTVNGKLYSDFDFETFSFAESRYINTLIDYEHYGKLGQRIQKCFKEPYNKLDIYNELYNDGKITVREGMTYNVQLILADFAGNETKIIIPVEGKKAKTLQNTKNDESGFFVYAAQAATFDLGLATVYFPQHTFYKDQYLDLQKGTDTIRVHKPTVAAHRNFTLSFDVSNYSEQERKQLFIARLTEKKGEARYSKTYKAGGIFKTRTRSFGRYTLVSDTIPPKVRSRNFKNREWLNNYSYLSLEITDDLSGIASYDGFINDKWVLLEYEPKKNTLTFNFDDLNENATQCDFKVAVVDNVGNKTVYQATFFRK